MDGLFLTLGIYVVILLLLSVRYIINIQKEMNDVVIKKPFQKTRNAKAEKIKERSGLHIADREFLKAFYTSLNLYERFSDDEYSKIKRLHYKVGKELAASNNKGIPNDVVINVLYNLMITRKTFSISGDKHANPTIEDIAVLIKHNISTSRIVSLYAKGLSLSDILESREISETHAVALYS
jgi:hypothetical protein